MSYEKVFEGQPLAGVQDLPTKPLSMDDSRELHDLLSNAVVNVGIAAATGRSDPENARHDPALVTRPDMTGEQMDAALEARYAMMDRLGKHAVETAGADGTSASLAKVLTGPVRVAGSLRDVSYLDRRVAEVCDRYVAMEQQCTETLAEARDVRAGYAESPVDPETASLRVQRMKMEKMFRSADDYDSGDATRISSVLPVLRQDIACDMAQMREEFGYMPGPEALRSLTRLTQVSTVGPDADLTAFCETLGFDPATMLKERYGVTLPAPEQPDVEASPETIIAELKDRWELLNSPGAPSMEELQAAEATTGLSGRAALSHVESMKLPDPSPELKADVQRKVSDRYLSEPSEAPLGNTISARVQAAEQARELPKPSERFMPDGAFGE